MPDPAVPPGVAGSRTQPSQRKVEGAGFIAEPKGLDLETTRAAGAVSRSSLLIPTHPGKRAAKVEILDRIQRRALWLAVRMIDHANQEEAGGVKFGGHQASSASVISIMTALWFAHIEGHDKVAVKPHAAPAYHAIKYLTGQLDRSYLTRLRRRGGLQAYPSRTKDPDVADFSTGSVGLGAVAPLFSAAVRRYIDAHFGARPAARFIAIVGDAELDEGNVWEAIADPGLQELGNVMLIVDLNRQSLDRVVPGIQAARLERLFGESGWHVLEAKFGHKMQAAFALTGGEALREHIDKMPNEEYQALFAYQGADLRARFLANSDRKVQRLLHEVPDEELASLIHNLGGHDLQLLVDSYRACDAVADRPSVVFAYTIKGWGLPIAGHPLNHAALLSPEQVDRLRAAMGLNSETEWDRFVPGTPEAALCEEVGWATNNSPIPQRPRLLIPEAAGGLAEGETASTQEAFGRILVRLSDHPEVARRLVTASPDVSISTNLGGWINKVGVFAPEERPDFFAGPRLLKWHPGPQGRHIELGISEMNLFLLLGQLGLAHEHHGEMLLPIGTVYDPFVLRGLDAFIYSLYNGARFVVVGTPSGITLAPEGGAHQSSITPSVGLELPGVTFAEPAYGGALDWLLCDGLTRLCAADGESLYLRLSTRPIDQAPFRVAVARLGSETVRRHVLAGGYRLREPGEGEPIVLAASGPVLPEVLTAAELLADEGVAATVLDVTSMDRLYRDWKHRLDQATRTAQKASGLGHLAELITGVERSAPMVTIHDASGHAMAWMGSVFGQRVVPVGVEEFGESGTIPELYQKFGLLPQQIVNAALVALAR